MGYLARHAFSALSRLSFASETERVRTEANAKPPCEKFDQSDHAKNTP